MISSITLQKIRKLLHTQVSLNTHASLKSATFFFCLQWLITMPVSADTETLNKQSNIKEYSYEVVNVYLHDPEAFTQGLIFKDGFLYESTGLFGESSLRKVELETGKVLKKISIDRKYFSEGLATNNDQLIQLSWNSGNGFIYNAETFELTQTFNYPGDGWGLTFDNKHFILSDGSSYLRFLDETSMQEVKRVQVLKNGQPVKKINELEMVKGNIFANIWLSDIILMISPQSGAVIGQVNLTGLLKTHTNDPRGNVLNGIAYDAVGDRLFVTGKLWPKLFEIRLVPR
jgi:glutamine cyclotransferase